jgi:NNP family nitrate/nitrite transporter-like MFS transporter
MRAFHCAWWSFFVAFFSWFAIAPLLPYIREDLGLSKKEIWSSSIAGVGSTIFVRFLLGPLCDVYGPRVLMSAVLCLSAIPTACTGLIHTATDLTILRCLIGIAGGSFVMSQYWGSRMFTKEVVGTANALIGGWGNLGAGVTNLVVGSYLLPLFEIVTGGDTEMAWRTISIVPAVVSFSTGVVIYFISDDAPKGEF